MTRRVVAAFDFDGTITSRDTYRDFCIAAAGRLRFWCAFGIVSPLVALYVLGLLGNDLPKRVLFRLCFRGREHADFVRACERYSQQTVPGLVREGAREAIARHLELGHELVVVSASLAEWIEPWARTVGFRHVLATRAEARDGRLTGAFTEPCLHGPRKVEALRRAGLCSEDVELHAYGDSRGDAELLAAAHVANYRAFHGSPGTGGRRRR